LITDFRKKLKGIFESPYNSEFKLDSVCTLACKEAGAASASILVYSGKEDKLRCDGRYIDSKVGEINTDGNEVLDKVMNHICACEFIYDLKNSSSIGVGDRLFDDFNQKIMVKNDTPKDEFTDLVEGFGEWKECFESLKNAYRQESFSIGIGTGTETGEWYKRLLLDEKQIPGDIFIKNLNKIEPEKKNLCMKYLEKVLHLTFTAQYYVVLPLSTSGRNFGVLRFLFPDLTYIITYTNGEIKLKASYKKMLEDMAQNLSLHLEIDYFMDGHKGAILTSRKIRQDISTFENYLNSRCDLLSDIIRSKGAIIRHLDKARGMHKIVGCSKTLYDYRNSLENKGNTFFEQIVGRFAEDESILCIYFNCSDEPFKINEYVYREEMRKFSCKQRAPDLVGVEIKEVSAFQSHIGISNIAIFPLSQYPRHFLIFFNSENRRFENEDIQLLYPALQTLGLELKEHSHLLETKKRMADIRQMHEDISKIFRNKNRKCYEYIEDFSSEISFVIEKFEVFAHHIIWECISQNVPLNLSVEGNYILRDVTKKNYRNNLLKKNNFIDYPGDEYFRVPFTKKDFREKFIDYFKNGTLSKVFEIPLKPGYSYFNLPVFSEDESMPQWILTLIYRENNIDLVNDQDFFEFMEHLSHQIGLAWDKFQENIAAKLLESIDYRLGGEEKTKSHSTLDQLKIISRILAREIQVDWCAFFLVNEQENTLQLETSNVDMALQLNYSLIDHSDIIVNCFNESNNLWLFGRESLEDIIKPEKMKPIEKGIRTEKKNKKFKQGKHYFTPYILFEHALFFSISFGTKRLGLITLFRAKEAQEPEPLGRFKYVTRPFSWFETHLLKKVQRHIFNIFISHYAVQRRMREIRDIIAQVISPISESITSTAKPIAESTAAEDVYEKLRYVNALSRVASQYVMNFEILLDIDTRKIEPKREKIPDLRKYLIDFARLYTPLIRPKCIHINVTQDTPNNISLEVDRDLFHVVISNIIDNSIKYSFDPEDRLKHGLSYKPASIESKENVLITADEDEESVSITVSSYGIGITEEEKSKIFDREFRGVQAPDRAKGTGIGLYLAKEIIKMHNGTVGLVSGTPSYNTVFKITLPKMWVSKQNMRVLEDASAHSN